MSPRTPTHPPNDKSMWRRLISRAHPDVGGEHELFVWATATRDVVCGGELGGEIPRRSPRREPSREAASSDVDRVPFDSFADFSVLTHRAVTMASAGSYAPLLRTLADCYPATDGPLYDQQRLGATYKQLAAIGHRAHMSKAERVRWYRLAESIPLSQRHAGHILGRLQKAAA